MVIGLETTAAEEIRRFLLERYVTGDGSETLRDDDLLLEGGIIDSGSVMEVVAFLEEHFGIRVADDDLVVENFATLRDIAAFVAARRAAR